MELSLMIIVFFYCTRAIYDTTGYILKNPLYVTTPNDMTYSPICSPSSPPFAASPGQLSL